MSILMSNINKYINTFLTLVIFGCIYMYIKVVIILYVYNVNLKKYKETYI